MRRLIAYFTHEHEIVLDPFNGVGTSSLCAAQLGRGYIGIELSEKYHSLATDRHNLLARGGDPFAKSKDVPTAKNSRVRRMGHVRYPVAKKALQLEVKTIAVRLGRLPTRAEVAKYSRYPMSYFEDYFVSWGEVCAAARTTGMSEKRHGSAAETQLTLLSSE
jgi:site-specific DNA-methyltransferase (adenine-specific)